MGRSLHQWRNERKTLFGENRVPTLCLDSGTVHPLRLRWVTGVCVFRCNLPAPGSFTCHCGNTGVERTPNKSKHTKLTREKKILQPLLPGFELATFRSRVRRPYPLQTTVNIRSISLLQTTVNIQFISLLQKA